MAKVVYYKTRGQEQAERLVRQIRGEGLSKRNVSALARAIEEPRETVSRWLSKPCTMPLHAAIALMKALGMSAEEVARELR